MYNKPKVNIHHTVLHLAQQAGLDVDYLCDYLGLTKQFLLEKSETMDTNQIIKFWDMANNEIKVERPGLYFAQKSKLSFVGIVGDLISKLNNLQQMIEVTCSVRNIITEMIDFFYEEDGDKIILTIKSQKIWEKIDIESSYSACEYTLSNFYQVMNKIVPKGIKPLEVGIIPSSKSQMGTYIDYFKTEIKFGDSFYMTFSKEDLQQQISTRNKLLHSHYLDLCKEQNLEETDGNSLKSHIEDVIFYTCWPNIPTAEEMASYLFVSYKKLQRDLAKENITYRDIINKVKSRYALNMLQSKKFNAGEVSDILNYKDLSSFSRAFKEYHGFGIREFKKNN